MTDAGAGTRSARSLGDGVTGELGEGGRGKGEQVKGKREDRRGDLICFGAKNFGWERECGKSMRRAEAIAIRNSLFDFARLIFGSSPKHRVR